MQRWGSRFIVTLLAFSTAWSETKTELHSYFFGDAAYFSEVQDFIGANRSAEPFTRFIGGLDFYTWPSENFMIQVNPELISSTQLPLQPGNSEKPPSISYVAYVEEGKAVWTYGDAALPRWRTTLGWQYYKDNPHTRIFGDYLVRSMIYPSLVFTSFHKARTQVFGLRLENHLGDMFGHNFMVTSETQRYPYYDISLVYSASAKLANLFEVGVGVNWVSAIPVRPSRTSPRGGEYFQVGDNIYKEVDFQEGIQVKVDDSTSKVIGIRRVVVDNSGATPIYSDSIGQIEIITNVNKQSGPTSDTTVRSFELLRGKMAGVSGGLAPSSGGYNNPELKEVSTRHGLLPGVKGSATQYTFSGQIFTVSMALNPFGNMETGMGKDPFKIYTEAAVLGWKNYAGYYEDRRDRIPIMFGLNLPTFKVLDFVTVEAEYFPSKIAPTWLNRFRRNVPQPGTGEIESFDRAWSKADRYTQDDWKWGFATRKTYKGFAVAAQAGSDHMHSSTFNESFHEIMSRPSHWYVMFRMILATSLI